MTKDDKGYLLMEWESDSEGWDQPLNREEMTDTFLRERNRLNRIIRALKLMTDEQFVTLTKEQHAPH